MSGLALGKVRSWRDVDPRPVADRSEKIWIDDNAEQVWILWIASYRPTASLVCKANSSAIRSPIGLFLDFAKILKQSWPMAIWSNTRAPSLCVLEKLIKHAPQNRSQFEPAPSSLVEFGVHGGRNGGGGKVIHICRSEQHFSDVFAGLNV